MADYDDQNSSEYKDHEPRKQPACRSESGTAPEMFRRIQIRQTDRISKTSSPRTMTGRCRLRILDRIRTGRTSRMAGQMPPQNQRDRILTGRTHSNGRQMPPQHPRAESLLAEPAEQRTVPTAERQAAVLAESVQ